MTRARDVIDVRLTDEQETISPTLALADLRAAIFNATGHDIERGDYYRIVVKRMTGTGNRSMHAYVAYPRDATTPDDVMRRGFVSLFGQPAAWMADDMIAAVESGQRATFAIPMAGARAA
jgi:hypothetical protein